MRKRLQAEPGLRIIDNGFTSPSNINYLTNLGHSIFLTDMVVDACTENWQIGTDEDDNPVWDIPAFFGTYAQLRRAQIRCGTDVDCPRLPAGTVRCAGG